MADINSTVHNRRSVTAVRICCLAVYLSEHPPRLKGDSPSPNKHPALCSSMSLSPAPHVAATPLPRLQQHCFLSLSTVILYMLLGWIFFLLLSFTVFPCLSFMCSLSLDFAVFKTEQSVYCRITAIVCFKFDSCFIQLPSVEAAR